MLEGGRGACRTHGPTAGTSTRSCRIGAGYGRPRCPPRPAAIPNERLRIIQRNGSCSIRRLAQARRRGLPAADPRVEWWAYEAVTVAYDDGDTIRNTVPDFLVKLVSGRRVIVESKASWSIAKELRKLVETRDFARRLGMTFAVLTEYDLAQEDPLAEIMTFAPWFPTQGIDGRLLI